MQMRKNIFLTKYNIREWSNISYEDKSKHALFKYPECIRGSYAGKRKAKRNGWIENKQDNENEKKKKKKNLQQHLKF